MTEQWEKVLTSGAIKNGNISFKGCPFTIDPAFVGGTNASAPAARTITVTFKPGSVSQQWFDSDKMLFANRHPHTKDFFSRVGAREGMAIRITKTSQNSLLIEKA